jgi:hypothetical protein
MLYQTLKDTYELKIAELKRENASLKKQLEHLSTGQNKSPENKETPFINFGLGK